MASTQTNRAQANGTQTNGTEKANTCLVPYIDPKEQTGEVKEILDSMPYTRNIFLLLGNSSGLYPPLMRVYQSAFNKEKRKIPLLDWMLIVLRIAARLDAPYPWDVNEPVARINGLGQERLDAMAEPPEAVQADAAKIWSERQKAILKLVDEQLQSYTNEAATVENAKKHLSVEEIVEIYILLGVYTLIARITRGLRIDMDGEIPGLEENLKKMIK
jgi:hypothetical protein